MPAGLGLASGSVQASVFVTLPATMGKKGKKAQAGKPKKLTPKDVSKRLDALAKKLEEELEGADLFAPLPPAEDCAICFVPLPRFSKKIGKYYQACCGKDICVACYKENEASINKQNEENGGKKLPFTCPFCRESNPTCMDEEFAQLQARCLENDHNALTMMGSNYRKGDSVPAKDDLKAFDYFIQAVELGSALACTKIGLSYNQGNGVAVNKKRAVLFGRMGALRGDIVGHHNIGCIEYYDLGNHEIGIRHWKVAAEAGYQNSIDQLRKIYNADGKMPGKEFVTKEYLDSAYRACHGAQIEVKSEEREKHSDVKG